MKSIFLIMSVLGAAVICAVPAGAEDQPSQPSAQEEMLLPLLDNQSKVSISGDPTAAGVVMAGRPSQPVAEAAAKSETKAVSGEGYLVGVNDILEISVLEPEELLRLVRVAPDGTITFPYIGTVMVKGLNIPQIEEKIRLELSDGYLKFPVVQVALKESNSKLYMVYGEVNRPGSYQLEEYSTVMRAISVAGGFTKFGNSSRVKVLRPRQNGQGYDTVKIDINKVMGGDSTEDVQLKAGDMVVVSEGVF
ncbi:MAG: polysaccharide export protein [Candidatus Omnitrophica bacterium]|nr:polysaccharide export protein [Candidatus Omnitrophota bacterium]